MRGTISRMALGTLVLTMLLGGCGVGSQPMGLLAPQAAKVDAKQAATVFPTQPGFVWQYDVVAHPADDPFVDYKGTETIRLESVRRQGEAVTLECRAIDTFTERYRFPVLSMSGDAIELRGVTYWGTAASDTETLTVAFLRLPLKAGSKWDDGLWSGEVKGRERVTVPTGTYDAWKVSVIGTYEQQYTAVGNYWVAPGVGIVKSDLSIPGWNVESELIVAAVQR